MCTRAAKRFEARNDLNKLVLRASIENQVTIYRPDEQGELQLVRDQQWYKDLKWVLDAPSKGIKPKWAAQRIQRRGGWKNGQPPEPDFSLLPEKTWLHGPGVEQKVLALQDKPDQDKPNEDHQDPLIDCRIEDIYQDLTEEERRDARLADHRLDDIDIPDIITSGLGRQKIGFFSFRRHVRFFGAQERNIPY